MSQSYSPEILFLNLSPDKEKARALLTSEFLLISYGATYGFAALPENWQKVGTVRQEDLSNPPVLSLVATYSTMLSMIDLEQLNPVWQTAINSQLLRVFEQISFLRFPANQNWLKKLHPQTVNNQGEIQVFPMPDNDPLLQSIKPHDVYVVRSSNITGRPEEPDISGVYELAIETHTPAVVFFTPSHLYSEPARQRTMSQPIHKIDSRDQLICLRPGNTEELTIKNLAHGMLAIGISYIFNSEREKIERPKYRGRGTTPQAVRADLLQASGLL